MKRLSFIPVLVLALFLCFMLACATSTKPEKVETEPAVVEEPVVEEASGEEPIEEEPATSEEIFVIGDTVRMGDLVFTLNSARWEEGDEWNKPKEGERWLVLDCTVENESSEPTTISSMLMFSLYDEDSYSRDVDFFADTEGSLDGELGVGRKMRGEIAFDVEEGQSYWEFIFEPEVFDFGQAIFAINEDEVQ